MRDRNRTCANPWPPNGIEPSSRATHHAIQRTRTLAQLSAAYIIMLITICQWMKQESNLHTPVRNYAYHIFILELNQKATLARCINQSTIHPNAILLSSFSVVLLGFLYELYSVQPLS